jgi:hypothetical protein
MLAIMLRLKILKTKTTKATPEHDLLLALLTPEHDLLLALFDVKYNGERLIPGYTGSAKYFVYKKTKFLPNIKETFLHFS